MLRIGDAIDYARLNGCVRYKRTRFVVDKLTVVYN